eukprot:758759-Hanusia_phi.AAC.1
MKVGEGRAEKRGVGGMGRGGEWALTRRAGRQRPQVCARRGYTEIAELLSPPPASTADEEVRSV